jgi:hypothetical protein
MSSTSAPNRRSFFGLGAAIAAVPAVATQAAFLTTRDGVVLFDAPPTIGHNLQRATGEVAPANNVSGQVTTSVPLVGDLVRRTGVSAIRF